MLSKFPGYCSSIFCYIITTSPIISQKSLALQSGISMQDIKDIFVSVITPGTLTMLLFVVISLWSALNVGIVVWNSFTMTAVNCIPETLTSGNLFEFSTVCCSTRWIRVPYCYILISLMHSLCAIGTCFLYISQGIHHSCQIKPIRMQCRCTVLRTPRTLPMLHQLHHRHLHLVSTVIIIQVGSCFSWHC